MINQHIMTARRIKNEDLQYFCKFCGKDWLDVEKEKQTDPINAYTCSKRQDAQ